MAEVISTKLDIIMDQMDSTCNFMATASTKQIQLAKAHMEEMGNLEVEFKQATQQALQFNLGLEEENKIPVKALSSKFTDLKLTIRGKFLHIVESCSSKSVKVESNVENTNILKLPKIVVPIFEGNIADWVAFYSLFEELVHKNSSLNNLEKFQYLKTFLKGEPLTIVNRFILSENNYEAALNSLIKRYQSLRLLVNHYVSLVLQYTNNGNKHFNLSNFLQIHESTYFGLNNLNLKNPFDALFFQICYSNLPIGWRTKVDEHFQTESGSLPDIVEFFDYIQSMNKSFELRQVDEQKQPVSTRPEPKRIHNITEIKFTCPICKKNHKIYNCERFLNMKVDERYDIVKQKQLCFNCLRIRKPDHNPCPSKSGCKVCSKRHNTLLHKNVIQNSNNNSSFEQPENTNKVFSAMNHSSGSAEKALLATITAFSSSIKGNATKINCLLDQGSEISLITSDMTTKLGLKIQKCKNSIMGVTNIPSSVIGSVKFTIYKRKSMHNCASLEINALVVDNITSKLPSEQIPFETYLKVANYYLADTEFHKPKEIHVLLGCREFCAIVDQPKYGLSFIKGSPTLMWTKFGYIVMGKVPQHTGQEFSVNLTTIDHLNDLLEKFWKEEEVEDQEIATEEDAFEEKHFQDTHRRNEKGEYIVALPFKNLLQDDNFVSAKHRFLQFEKRLKINQELANQHVDHFQDYFDNNHAEPASNGKYFIPYHYVIKPQATTTKYRAVFDASSSAIGQTSLNQCLYKGPQLNNDLTDVLLRFRFGAVTLTADISKMYRRIWIRQEDRKYQHILYKSDNDEEIRELQLNTVTFGLTSSPFQAVRVLRQLVVDEGSKFPLASQVILNNFYMDDCIVSVNDEATAVTLRSELINLCNKAGFPLHKWNSNKEGVIHTFTEYDGSNKLNFDTDPQKAKVLQVNKFCIQIC